MGILWKLFLLLMAGVNTAAAALYATGDIADGSSTTFAINVAGAVVTVLMFVDAVLEVRR